MKYRGVPAPSPAMIVALIALVVALGGTSYAAFSLPKNSVGSKQLKRNAVTTPKIKNSAVTTSKLKDGSVTGAKVAPQSLTGANILLSSLGQVPMAFRANTADSATNAVHANTADSATNASHANSATTAGSANTAGHADALSSVSYRTAGPNFIGKCLTDPCKEESAFISTVDAVCPAGQVAIGGGANASPGLGAVIHESRPITLGASTVPNAWEASANNYSATFDGSLTAYVVCIAASAVDNPSGI